MSLQPLFLPASVPRNSFSVLIAQPKVTISRCLVFNVQDSYSIHCTVRVLHLKGERLSHPRFGVKYESSESSPQAMAERRRVCSFHPLPLSARRGAGLARPLLHASEALQRLSLSWSRIEDGGNEEERGGHRK